MQCTPHVFPFIIELWFLLSPCHWLLIHLAESDIGFLPDFRSPTDTMISESESGHVFLYSSWGFLLTLYHRDMSDVTRYRVPISPEGTHPILGHHVTDIHLDSCQSTMSYVRCTTSYNTYVAHDDALRQARTT